MVAVADGRRVSLGRGSVLAAAGATALWCAVARPSGGVDVVAAEPATARTVLTRDTMDITDRCWALPTRPGDVDDHVTRWVGKLSGLDAYWHPQDGGPARPLADGMSDSRVEPDGVWPDLGVRVTFRHPWYPDGVMTRRIRLTDELGRAADPGHPEVYLMEHIATRRLPPPSEALDGVLSV